MAAPTRDAKLPAARGPSTLLASSMSGQVRLLLGSAHACGYLDGREARSAFIDPNLQLNPDRYSELLRRGFRRSGAYVYRPACATCSACQPVRIPTAAFAPNRAQQRCLKRNADLSLTRDTRLSDEHFALYRRYLSERHAGGGMDPNDPVAFHSFLECPWGETQVWDFRFGSRLIATAIVDVLPQALSAVYTFFEPSERRRSLGTLAVLKQIEQARHDGRPHLYLGYWVKHSPKMAYKRRFRPLEVLSAAGWQTAAG